MKAKLSLSVFFRCVVFSLCFSLLGCTKTCVGFPELGSKQRPVRFYIDGWTRMEESVESFKKLSSCLESESGYRVSFEVAADEKAVASALAQSDIHFGSMSALGFVEAKSRYPVESLLVVSEKGAPSTRAVILGKAVRWKVSLASLGIPLNAVGLRNETALTPITDKRFAYLSPSSDVGFVVPRHLLLQRGIFPGEAIFTSSYPLTLQAIEKDMVIAGAVSESFIESVWVNSTPVQVGFPLGEFIVLAVSQGLPGKVIVARKDLPDKLRLAMMDGLESCSNSTPQSDVQRIFGGDGFLKAQAKMFDFIEELRSFQQENVRVLSAQ